MYLFIYIYMYIFVFVLHFVGLARIRSFVYSFIHILSLLIVAVVVCPLTAFSV